MDSLVDAYNKAIAEPIEEKRDIVCQKCGSVLECRMEVAGYHVYGIGRDGFIDFDSCTDETETIRHYVWCPHCDERVFTFSFDGEKYFFPEDDSNEVENEFEEEEDPF